MEELLLVRSEQKDSCGLQKDHYAHCDPAALLIGCRGKLEAPVKMVHDWRSSIRGFADVVSEIMTTATGVLQELTVIQLLCSALHKAILPYLGKKNNSLFIHIQKDGAFSFLVLQIVYVHCLKLVTQHQYIYKN